MHNSPIACTSQTCASKSDLYKWLLAFYVAKTIKKSSAFHDSCADCAKVTLGVEMLKPVMRLKARIAFELFNDLLTRSRNTLSSNYLLKSHN